MPEPSQTHQIPLGPNRFGQRFPTLAQRLINVLTQSLSQGQQGPGKQQEQCSPFVEQEMARF